MTNGPIGGQESTNSRQEEKFQSTRLIDFNSICMHNGKERERKSQQINIFGSIA